MNHMIDSVDLYGQRVSFDFNKKKKFNSAVGLFFTIVTMLFMVSYSVNRMLKLVSKEDPFFSMLTMPSEYQEVDLWELNYMFAIEDVEPRIG